MEVSLSIHYPNSAVASGQPVTCRVCSGQARELAFEGSGPIRTCIWCQMRGCRSTEFLDEHGKQVSFHPKLDGDDLVPFDVIRDASGALVEFWAPQKARDAARAEGTLPVPVLVTDLRTRRVVRNVP